MESETRFIYFIDSNGEAACSEADFYPDGDMDGVDAKVFASAFGSPTGENTYDSATDFDDDGDVDEYDRSVLAAA